MDTCRRTLDTVFTLKKKKEEKYAVNNFKVTGTFGVFKRKGDKISYRCFSI